MNNKILSNQLTNIVETIFDTEVLSMHTNYANEHDILGIEEPINKEELRYLPVFTFSTVLGKTANMDEELAKQSKNLDAQLVNLNRKFIVIVQ